MALPAKQRRYTFADMLAWTDNERAELISGEVFSMAPAPSRSHQEIGGEVFRQLANYLEGKKCKVYYAPFDVRLFEKDGDAPEDVDTVVEPDITVVCDLSKLDDRGCKGAPDMVVEVLSPSNQRPAAPPRSLWTGKCGKGQCAGWLLHRFEQGFCVVSQKEQGANPCSFVYGLSARVCFKTWILCAKW